MMCPVMVAEAELEMNKFIYRLIGAAMLDAGTYEAVEADRHFTAHAFATVLLSSVAAGIGATGWFGPHVPTLVLVTVVALVTWVAWAVLVFQIGTRVLPGPSTMATVAELLRTTGVAAAPGLLLVFATMPGMTLPVFVGAFLWMFGAMVVGVRHALDYDSTGRALAVCAVSAGLSVALAIAIGFLLEPTVS